MRVRLAEEPGADPGPELQRVHAELLAARPPQPPADGAAATTRPVVPRQLPADIDGFMGRKQELAAWSS